MMETAIATTVISGVASAGMSVLSGVQAAQGAKAERRQYEYDRDLAYAEASEGEIRRTKDLKRVLATNQALRAGRGLAFSSGTADAIEEANIAEARADIGVANLNAYNKALRNSYAIAASRQRQDAGYLSAASGFVKGLSSAASGFGRLGSLGGASGSNVG